MYDLAGVRVDRIREEEEQIVVEATPAEVASACPTCGRRSNRVHSTYMRVLRDLPACGRPVRVQLLVRRLFCDAPSCRRRAFAEQISGTTERYRRATVRLEAVLTALGAAVGGEAGARLAGRLGTAVTGDTLLRLLLREPRRIDRAPVVLGVDDWAWRRGRRYGSVLVDLEAGRPVDLLPDRTAATLAQWLQEHPGAEIIVRDRSTEYARGAALGAPAAVQVLDRWHVLRNVREVAERLLDQHRQELRRLVVTEGTATVPRRRSVAEEERRQAVQQRTAERHATIHRLADEGEGIAGIARRLQLTRTTVRRYLAAATPPERNYAAQTSVLDPHLAYLRERWAAGCHNALQLWRELQERGIRGSSRPVSRWAAAQRTTPAPTTPRRQSGEEHGAAAPRAPRPPSVPRLAWLLVRDPSGLEEDEQQLLTQVQAVCAPAATAYPLLQSICRIIKEQIPDDLDGWLQAAADCGVPAVITFAAGLQRERTELLAALRLPWSTGPVEGQITRLKLIKRQAYGRAGLEQLKRRVLRAA
jgi:transposase